jgi:hypothetical protein
VESSCEFGIEPSGSIKCWETISVTGRAGLAEDTAAGDGEEAEGQEVVRLPGSHIF